jgi:hypothetical protein
MTVQLPDFRLEVYLGEWEFRARHHLTASDAETLTLRPRARPGAHAAAGVRPVGARALPERHVQGVWTAGAAHRLARHPWEHPQGGCVCFPRYLGGDASRFCRELVEEAGVVLLPADIYASELGAVPRDRFRIGVGRRDPEPALAAFEAFLAAR